MKDLPELLDKWQRENGGRCLEGGRGVETLEKLTALLGYRDGHFIGGSPILNFLADNSGAIEAILEWIGDSKVDEWVEALRDELPEEEEESEEEEEEDKEK